MPKNDSEKTQERHMPSRIPRWHPERRGVRGLPCNAPLWYRAVRFPRVQGRYVLNDRCVVKALTRDAGPALFCPPANQL